PYSIQVNLSEYYALVTHMDDQIGRILEALEQSGLAEDTVIIFSADHGLGVGQHGLLGKQNMYDHSLRVPWIIAGPEIPKGKTISQPIYLQDAMATCLELAGASIPDSVEFQSVLPLIRGELSSARTAVYSCYTYHQRAVTDGHYKLIVYPMIHTELLFDLSKDPLETTNLAGNPEYQTVLEKARAQLKNQMLLMNDPLDLDDPVASAKAFEKSKRKAKH
ncbi:MAG: sulfatase/phosphatase domain-containing protein, partial [Coraliomargarita sp.]